MSTNGTRLTSTQAWVLALTSAASLMVSLDTQVVATALPVIRLQLHASLAELEWTVNAYTLTFAVLLLAATSALGIVWALIRANTLGWTSPEIAATLAAGIVLGAAFIGWELRVADPMVPLRLFRSRPIAAGNAATFSVSMAIPATMSAVMTAVPPAAIGQASGHARPQASTRVSRCRPASPESRTEDRDQEITMSQSIIRYRTKPDQADANAELVRAVYAELHRTRPDGFRYTTLRLDDQVTFVHITQSERDPSPILEIKAFGEFQAGIRDRCDEPPVAQAFTEVGSYRFLTG